MQVWCLANSEPQMLCKPTGLQLLCGVFPAQTKAVWDDLINSDSRELRRDNVTDLEYK